MNENKNNPLEFNLPENLNTESKNYEVKETKKELHINEIVPRMSSISKPIVVLVGPKSSGKTVTLLRLAKYLKKSGDYAITPNEHFRDDIEYPKVCEEFNALLNSSKYAPNPTVPINFLLLDVFKDRKPLIHILEAPGEAYFDESNPYNKTYRSYFIELINSNHKKIFVFFFEKNMLKSDELQKAYSERLSNIVSQIKPKNGDKIIFLLNKVDRLHEETNEGVVDPKDVKRFIYGNANFNSLKIRINNTRNLEGVSFVPFSSGDFNDIDRGRDQVWILSNEIYPKKLWQAINFKPFKLFGFSLG